jgi:Tetracyclin repressor-like, C-terminal domain
MTGPQALALHEALLELLDDAGLSPADAPRASYLLIIYVVGSIALVVADAQELGPLPSEAEWIAARRRALAGTPADHYPRAAAAAAARAAYISTEQYLWGLRRNVDGITTSSANRRRCRRRQPSHLAGRRSYLVRPHRHGPRPGLRPGVRNRLQGHSPRTRRRVNVARRPDHEASIREHA